MSITTITPQGWEKQPWKNGGGITHEIASSKDEDGIIWRLSVAEVKQDGPFSLFPGIERLILLLDGDGFNLSFKDEHNVLLDQPYKPFNFAGENEIECTLLGGTVRDFNLMTRRGNVKVNFNVVHLKLQQTYQIQLSTQHLIFIVHGLVEIKNKNNTFDLETEHLLIVSNENCSLHLQCHSNSATIFLIDLI